MRLRHKFFLAFSLLTAVPLLVLLFGVVERVEREITVRTEQELHGTLDKMADELDLLLNSQMSIAKGLARVPAVRQFSAAVANREEHKNPRLAEELEEFFLNYQHAVPTIQALRFIEAEGKTLVKVKEGEPVPAQTSEPATGRLYVADQSRKIFFQRALAEKSDVSMSDFELGQVTLDADFCPAMVRYSVKLKDDLESLEGLLVVNMWGNRVDTTVEASLGGYPGKPYIVELNPRMEARDGIYLYHPENDQRFANQLGTDFRLKNQLTAAEWEAINTNELGSLYRSDGRMLFYRRFAPYKDAAAEWALIIETTSDQVLAPVKNLRHGIWALLGAVLLGSLLVAIWAAMRLTQPVNELADIITRYADGDHSVRFKGTGSDEIGSAGRAFNYLTSSLERAKRQRDDAERAARQSERLAAVGQMAAGIGHEINNPLMNIMSLAALVDKSLDEKDEQTRSDIQLLIKEGQRCARIVQGILSFARENKAEYRRFDIAHLIDDTLVLLQHRLESAQLSLDADIESPLMMEGDPNQLQQVLVNVLLNAIQASPSDSTIALNAFSEAGNVLIEITDNGPGIAVDNLSQVLDPFFTTKSEGDGTGLGLSISYGIVKHHGGTINLDNKEGAGVRVVIALPIRREPANNGAPQLEAVNVV